MDQFKGSIPVRGVPISQYKVLRAMIAEARKHGVNLTWDDMVKAKLCKAAKRQSQTKYRHDAVKKLESVIGVSLDRVLTDAKATISK